MKNHKKSAIKTRLITLILFMSFLTGPTQAQTTQTPNAEAAPECYACGTPPAQFHNYNQFVKDIINSIGTIGTEGDYTGRPVPPSRYQGEVFVVPEQQQFTLNQMRNGMKERFVKTANTFGATAAVLFSIGREIVTRDGIGGFTILFKGQSFVTARGMLLDLDALIHNKMFELGLGGGFFAKVTPTNRDVIQKKINNYVRTTESTGTLLEYAQLSEGVRYFHITEMLLRTNSAMKRFISTNSITHFENKEFQKGRENDKGNGKFDLKFNYKEIENLQNNYQCARGLEGLRNCNKSFKKFAASIVNIGKSFVKGTKGPKQTIIEANQKFAEAFGVLYKEAKNMIKKTQTALTNGDKAFKDEEEKLLMDLYGLDTSQMIENGRLAKATKFRSTLSSQERKTKSYREQKQIVQQYQSKKEATLKQAQDTITQTANFFSEGRKRGRNETMRNCLEGYDDGERRKFVRLINAYINKHETELLHEVTTCSEIISITNMIEASDYNEDSILASPLADRKDALKDRNIKASSTLIYTNSIDEVLRRQSNQNKTIVASDTQDLMLFFDEILRQTHTTREIIGDKDSGILKFLGNACKEQCKNKPGKCDYP